MKIFDSNEERIIIGLNNRQDLTVTNEGISIKYKVGNGHRTAKLGFDDFFLMNATIAAITKETTDKLNNIKQILASISKISPDQCDNQIIYNITPLKYSLPPELLKILDE